MVFTSMLLIQFNVNCKECPVLMLVNQLMMSKEINWYVSSVAISLIRCTNISEFGIDLEDLKSSFLVRKFCKTLARLLVVEFLFVIISLNA